MRPVPQLVLAQVHGGNGQPCLLVILVLKGVLSGQHFDKYVLGTVLRIGGVLHVGEAGAVYQLIVPGIKRLKTFVRTQQRF